MVIAILLLVLSSGCVHEEEETEIKEISIPGHYHSYIFSYDIRESLNVTSSDPDAIMNLVGSADVLDIVFDGSSEEDNSYFSIALFNIASKLNNYFIYEGKIWKSQIFYYIGDHWYNSSTEEIEKPELGPAIWFLGPNTNATETSVKLVDNIIYIQGTSGKDIELAADKFSLNVMGIRKVDPSLTGQAS